MRNDDLAGIRRRLATLGRSPTPEDVAGAMRAEGLVVSDAALMACVETLRRDSVGAGVLEPLLRREGVTDVLVNGPAEVFIDRGEGLERTGVTFTDDAEVRRLAARMAASAGRRFDEGAPFVDSRLPDGTRVHAILASVADPGTCLSLRVPARRRFSLDDWVERGSVPAQGAALLREVVASRLAFLVCGGTGTGKTTLLASMLAEVPSDERLVVVEDSRELNPEHPHCVRLEARAANAEGAGAVTLTDLVRQALRMRPDRIAVGEVRGAELTDLLTALNTGHEGGCGTIHANSAADVPARLTALAALGGLSPQALVAQASAALDVVVPLVRRDGRRQVAGIHVLRRAGAGHGAGEWAELEAVPAVEFEDDRCVPGPALDELRGMCGR